MNLKELRLEMLLDGWSEVPTENRVKWHKDKQVVWHNHVGQVGYSIFGWYKTFRIGYPYQASYDEITVLMEKYYDKREIV